LTLQSREIINTVSLKSTLRGGKLPLLWRKSATSRHGLFYAYPFYIVSENHKAFYRRSRNHAQQAHDDSVLVVYRHENCRRAIRRLVDELTRAVSGVSVTSMKQIMLNLNSDTNAMSTTRGFASQASFPRVVSEFFDFMPTNRRWQGGFQYSFGRKVKPKDVLLFNRRLRGATPHSGF